MKTIQQLILEISENKGLSFVKLCFIIVPLMIAYTFFVLLFVDFVNQYYYFTLGISIILALAILLIFISFLIIKFKVTAFKKRKDEIILLHHSGKSVRYEYPLWGKIPYSKIIFTENWRRIMEGSATKSITFPINICIENENKVVMIVYVPITLTLEFSGSLREHDIETMCFRDDEKKSIRQYFTIEDYLKEKFYSLNSDKKQRQDLTCAASDWLSGKNSAVHLTQRVRQTINFPKYIFSNVKEADIKVGLPDSRLFPINRDFIFSVPAYNNF